MGQIVRGSSPKLTFVSLVNEYIACGVGKAKVSTVCSIKRLIFDNIFLFLFILKE